MISANGKKAANCVTQNAKAKSSKEKIVAQISRLVRKHGLDYDGWRYVSKRVRKECDLRPGKKAKKLPNVLTAEEFRRFFKIVDQCGDVQHILMLRLAFFTGVRVSELCNIKITDVDIEAFKIKIVEGKGSKDRYVLFSKSFATALRTHIANHKKNRWLFQTRRNTKYSARRVQQIVKEYAEKAGVKASPHTFRHQCLTYLTKNSGLVDSELQLLSGHSRKETLSIYQHIAVDGKTFDRYEQAMKDAF